MWLRAMWLAIHHAFSLNQMWISDGGSLCHESEDRRQFEVKEVP